jgi:hypothetical protein
VKKREVVNRRVYPLPPISGSADSEGVRCNCPVSVDDNGLKVSCNEHFRDGSVNVDSKLVMSEFWVSADSTGVRL